MKKIHIIGGGTFSHVRNHLALAAPAFGKTARELHNLFDSAARSRTYAGHEGLDVELHLTKMADPQNSVLVTNEDVAKLIDRLVKDKNTRVIILNAALCDYDGAIREDWTRDPQPSNGQRWHKSVIKGENPLADDGYGSPSGKYERRLKTSDGVQQMFLTPADKIIGRIRQTRKDIFVVGFKTTTGATPDEQYLAGLDLLKRNSLNLVLANDTVTRHNMVIAPEETRYFEGERSPALVGMMKMVFARMQNTFTRSTVVEGAPVPFQTSPLVPDNLREVVNYLVERGAYKPFNGATAGHFAVRLDDGRCLTSRRKTDYTQPGGLDLVEVEYDGFDKVIAKGAKPSVGGQSQRIVFTEHADLDCIVHAHVPLRNDPDNPRLLCARALNDVPVAPQWQNECGSHQCGANTSRNLTEVWPGIWVVMLDNHGPNIVFSRDHPAGDIKAFIEHYFDLGAKTGGLVERELVAA